MQCEICDRNFATKYTLQRHMIGFHGKNNSEEDTESVITEDNQSEDTEMEDSNERPDFWNLLIKKTVATIIQWRISKGWEPSLDYTNPLDLCEGKMYSQLIQSLREEFELQGKLNSAQEDDNLINLIIKEKERMADKLTDDAFTDDDADYIAWNKYKYLVRKKVLQNLEELNPLVTIDEDDNDNDEEDSDQEEIDQNNIVPQ